MEELADGEVKLVNFWASWCAPCRAEHEYLMAFAEEGIPIYGINYKDEPVNGRKFLDDLGNPFTAVVSDESGRTGIDWGLYGVPETFVVDGDGVIVKRFAGPITGRSPTRSSDPRSTPRAKLRRTTRRRAVCRLQSSFRVFPRRGPPGDGGGLPPSISDIGRQAPAMGAA